MGTGEKEKKQMKNAAQSLRLFAIQHVNPKTLRVGLVLLTLVTLVIGAGAPISDGGPNSGR